MPTVRLVTIHLVLDLFLSRRNRGRNQALDIHQTNGLWCDQDFGTSELTAHHKGKSSKYFVNLMISKSCNLDSFVQSLTRSTILQCNIAADEIL